MEFHVQASSIIFVDQPVGTGFSYSSDIRDIRHDEKGVSEDMYHFLQVFQTFFIFIMHRVYGEMRY